MANASALSTSEIGFYVQAKIPENQRDLSHTYFDLQVASGISQTLRVDITNTEDVPITVSIQATNAYTNGAGAVDYRKLDIKDESLTVAFEEIAKIKQPEIHLKAGETKPVYILLTIPETPFEGEILGGLVFSKKLPETEEETLLTNQFTYIIGTFLTQSSTPVEPHLVSLGTQADLVNHRTTLVHSVRNQSPRLLSNGSLEISVYRNGETLPLWEHKKENIGMAPSSVIDYLFYLEGEELFPGTYQSHMTITFDQKTWAFEDTFTIDDTQAGYINYNSVSLASKEEPKIPTMWQIGTLLLLLAAIFILLGVYSHMKKKANKEPTNH